ncbi:MAG TPA: hypothetical protein VKB95_15245, partial [Chitinophagaceae bacterium]|nr:hypothetical protein [Chitinophagaceae bacterium]
MRKAPLLLLILALVIQSTAQDKTVAQLKKELEEHPQQDAHRADKLVALAFSIFVPTSERKKLLEEALSISQKINYKPGEAYAMSQLGLIRSYEGNLTEADSMLKRADYNAQEIGDPDLIGTVLYRIGQTKANAGNKEGMDYLFKAEKIFENSKNYIKLTRCQATIAGIYQLNFSNYPAAMEHLIKASASADKANTSEGYYNVWNSLQSLYLLLGDYDNALVY